MPASEKELEEQLTEVGARLSSFPSSVDELLPLLDRLEICLSRVTQDPSESLKKALAPSLKALVADVLLRHADFDVRVAVAACISEIIRITAPEAPYPDDQMKDIFQLIVSSFERLYDKFLTSYNKTVIILETFSRVRSFVLMLDLECNGLILEMFNNFLNTIRDDHPKSVFESMEAIMTLVFEESEEILQELVASILSRLERDNKEVLPVAQELGKKVLENCASKLKPFLADIINSLGKSLDNYINVVGDICQGTPGDELKSMNFAGNNLAAENIQSKTPDKADEVPAEKPLQTVPSDEVPVAGVSSPKAITTNGSREKEVDKSSSVKDSLPLAKSDVHNDPRATTEIDQIQAVAEEKTSSVTKSEPEIHNKKKGRKRNYLEITPETSQTHVDSNNEQKTTDNDGGQSKNTSSSAHNKSAADTGLPSKNERSNDPTIAPEVLGNESLGGNLLSPSRTVSYEIQSKNVGQGRKKVKLTLPRLFDSGTTKILEDAVVSESQTDRPTNLKGQTAEETSRDLPQGSDREVGKSSKFDAKSAEQAVKINEDVASPSADKKKKKREKGKSLSREVDSGSTKKLQDAVVSESQTDRPTDLQGQTAEESLRDLPQGSNRVGKSNKFDAKSAEQGVKINEDVASPSEDKKKKKREKGKSPSREVILATPAENIYKKPVCSPKSSSKPNDKDEFEKERSAKQNSKRKRTPGKLKAPQGNSLVGSRIKVWWPEDKTYYEGVIAEYIPEKHKVTYDDGEEEILVLKDEKWELVDDKLKDYKGHVGEGEKHDTRSEMHKNKKAKLNPELATKQAKKPRSGATPSNKHEATTSGKGEATPSSSVYKSKDEGDVDAKSKVATSEDEKGAKSKDKKGGRSADDASKSAGNSEDDMDMLLSSIKPKKGTSKSVDKSKTAKSKGRPSGSSSAGKPKADSYSKGKGEDAKKSVESTKTLESGKAEPISSSKGKKGDTKSGKK
ncbi:hypothetical protein Drorol1_Dr00016993 [Drosera rotundifolia]